jgi:hypothetical protein
MLLGSGATQFLNHRKKIKKELKKIGYPEVIIMEETDDKLTDKSLNEKFGRILNQYDIKLFIAIFHKGARIDGVVFEIGWLCGYYRSSQRIAQRLRILEEKEYNWDETTSYIKDLFPFTPRDIFDDSQAHKKAQIKIHKFVLNQPELT